MIHRTTRARRRRTHCVDRRRFDGSPPPEAEAVAMDGDEGGYEAHGNGANHLRRR